MSRVDRAIFCALAVMFAACGSKKEVAAAKHSLYDTDFAVVYTAALEATRELYPTLDDNPGPGKIQTAWHQVQSSSCSGPGSSCDDSVSGRSLTTAGGNPMAGMGTPGGGQAGMPTRLAYKRYFVRFDVSIVGGRPWRVKVVGHASEWEPGAAMPVELHGANKPPWLEPRSDALRVSIYKRIQKFAIPMKEEEPKSADDELPKTDPSTFKDMPAGAAKRLAEVKDAPGRRDYGALRPQLADDIVWSLGGGTGADAAMAMWQADPAQLEAMLAVLAACAADGDKRVTCPGGKPAAGAWQLVIEARGEAWKVTSFVKNE